VVETPEKMLLKAHCSCKTDGPVTVVGGSVGDRDVDETAIVPAELPTATASPSGVTPSTLLTGSVTVPVLEPLSVAFTTATTPLLIVEVFAPVARQVIVVPELQLTVLPADVAAEPGATLSDARFPGLEMTHCKPAGAVFAVSNVRFKEIEPPCTAEPELKVSVWAEPLITAAIRIKTHHK
jgi:hypothetical protein